MPDTVEFFGESFGIADRIGLMPLMRFAKVAQGGVDSNDIAGLTAMYDLLEQCLADSEWQRFQRCADKNRADGEQLMAVVREVMEKLAARPTAQPSDSSAGLPPTAPNSTASSSSAVIDRFSGRPDLQLLIAQTSGARAAS